ncbi:MAG: LysR family transcriptional regulator [Verrucomicrobia bacterium]|nr:LysR family transcriptional regulator [Verrucomicrobiota bacterium]
MHIENLKIFRDLVDNESFSKAAKLNSITQSAVSQQLRSMEKHFNVLIVDRSQKQFRLTREGRSLYEASRDILNRYEEVSSEMQEMRKVVSGTVHVSTIVSIGLHELPPYVKRFMQEYPHVNVRIEYRRSNLVYEDVFSSTADFGLVAYPQKYRQVEIIPFMEDQLVAICAPKHKLAGKKEIELADLQGCRFIGFDQDIPTRKALDQFFREQRIELEPTMEFDNIETLKRAVEVDAGVALVPEGTIRQEIEQGTLIKLRLRDRHVVRPLAILHRKGRVMTPAMKRFLSLMLNGLGNKKAEGD